MSFEETLTFLNEQLTDSTIKIRVYDKDKDADDLLGEYEGILTSQQVESQVLHVPPRC